MLHWLLTLLVALPPIVDMPSSQANMPLVIGLHGRGDTPENFSQAARRLGTDLHWLFLRGPLPWKADLQGTQWFDRQTSDGGKAALDAAIALVDGQVRKAGKKPVGLVGFSQGCMVAAHYTATYPDRVRAVLCFGGMLIAPVRVPAGKHAVQLRFIHGRNDPMVPIAKAREAVQILRDAGLQIVLTEHEGGHSMPPQLLPELRLWLLAQLR